MPIELIEFGGDKYPHFQATGFAARFAFPFAEELCKGIGMDIGCNRKDWAFPGAIPIDPAIAGCEHDAYNLPKMTVDFIFSSHCLEHLPNWVKALDLWRDHLRPGGILFLYLPHYSQKYWRSWSNRKHIHNLSPEIIRDYLESGGWKNIFTTGPDLNNSFYVVSEKSFPQ